MDKSIPALPSVQFVQARLLANYWADQSDCFASLFNKTCRMDYLIDHQVAAEQHERWAEEAQRLTVLVHEMEVS